MSAPRKITAVFVAALCLGNIAQAQSGTKGVSPSKPRPANNGYSAPANYSAPADSYSGVSEGYFAGQDDDGYGRFRPPMNHNGRDCLERLRQSHGFFGEQPGGANYNLDDTYVPMRTNFDRRSGNTGYSRDLSVRSDGQGLRRSQEPGRSGTRGFDFDPSRRVRAPRPVDYPGLKYPTGSNVSYTGTRPQIQATVRWQSKIKPAAEYARKNKRPMLVTVSADWCSHCQRMKKDAFRDAGFMREVSAARYVPVLLDSDANKELVSRLGIRSLPTTLIVSSDMRILERVEGYRTGDQLAKSLRRHARAAENVGVTKVAMK